MSLVHRLLKGEAALILFDLDGTLVDSAPDIALAIDAMLVERNAPHAGVDRVRNWMGNGSMKLVQRALAWHAGVAEDAIAEPVVEAAMQRYFHFYRQVNGAHSVIYDGVIDGLKRLQASGLALDCVTNKPTEFTDALLRSTGLHTFFTHVVAGDSLPTKKPDPAPLLYCMQQHQTTPATTLMVGDSRTDISAARAAGVAVVCVSYGYNHGNNIADYAPDAVIKSIAEL